MKRHLGFLPRASLFAVLFMPSLPIPGQTPAQPAVTAIPFSDPHFRELVPATADTAIGGQSTDLMPYGVILTNGSNRPVIAYTLEYVFDNGTATPPNHTEGYLQLFAFSDTKNPQFATMTHGTIAPGTSRLLTPAFSLQLPIPAHLDAHHFVPPDLIAHRLTEYQGYSKLGTFKGVSLVSYMLDDGVCYGPAGADLCDTVQGQLDGSQEVLGLVLDSNLESDRTSPQPTLEHFASMLPGAPPENQSMAYATAYIMTRRIWSENILRQVRSSMSIADLRGHLGQFRYAAKPVIRKPSM